MVRLTEVVVMLLVVTLVMILVVILVDILVVLVLPAYPAGLKQGDLVAKFGSVVKANFKNLKNISDVAEVRGFAFLVKFL